MANNERGVRCKVYIFMLLLMVVVVAGEGLGESVMSFCFSCIEQAHIMGRGRGGGSGL